MSLQSITEAMRQKMGEDSGLGSSLKFDCGADGIIVIDGSVVPNTISNSDRETDCTIGITVENLQALLDGELNGVSAFMSGKIKVEGDMSVAMKLQSVV